jgi:hypothetical protein
MKRTRIIGIIAILALVVAACGEATPTTTTQSPDAIGGPAITPSGPLAAQGETDQADTALISKALGPVDPSDEDELEHHPGCDRPGRPGSQRGDHRQGAGVLGATSSVTPAAAAIS